MTVAKAVAKSCPACPFSRKCQPGALGGATVDRFIGQAVGPFHLTCHKHQPDDNSDWRADGQTVAAIPGCAGAAIFRANVGLDKVLPQALITHEAGDPDIFRSAEEFIAHHLQCTQATAREYLRINRPADMLRAEMARVRPRQRIEIAKGD